MCSDGAEENVIRQIVLLLEENPDISPKDIAQALQKAIAFEGKTNGRDRILEMGLSNEQVAKRLVEIYKQILS